MRGCLGYISWFDCIVCLLLPITDFINPNCFEQVVSPFPPSDKIGINSVQREAEDIIPMKRMKMDWVPYVPLEKRYSELSLVSACNPNVAYKCVS